MTDTVQLAVLAAVVGAVAGFPAWLATLKNGRKAAEIGKKVDAVIVKAEEIHALANSNLSKATSALEVSNAVNAGLKAVIQEMVAAKLIADKLIDSTEKKP
jgi:hypothetical protein